MAFEKTLSPTASLTVNNAGTTTINAGGYFLKSLYASSSATATTVAYSNIVDGCTITIDYLKTTATDLVITFPSGTIISASSTAVIGGGGLTATLNSTSSGRFTISVLNINSVYKVYITQDVA